MIVLSERLRFIASLVEKGAKICDVGTDHGYLPLYLLRNGIVDSAIATDLREKPLESARNNAERLGGKGLSLRLCDGLSAVLEGEADTVIIAGMGGEVISGILERTEWVKNNNVKLILQAMTSAEVLREYLALNGFELLSETAITEEKRVYSVMVSRFTGVNTEITPQFYYVGKISPDTESGRRYIEKQLHRVSECAVKLENVSGKETECNKYKSASRDIGRLLEG